MCLVSVWWRLLASAARREKTLSISIPQSSRKLCARNDLSAVNWRLSGSCGGEGFGGLRGWGDTRKSNEISLFNCLSVLDLQTYMKEETMTFQQLQEWQVHFSFFCKTFSITDGRLLHRICLFKGTYSLADSVCRKRQRQILNRVFPLQPALSMNSLNLAKFYKFNDTKPGSPYRWLL